MRLRVTLAVVALLGLLVYGWLHSKPRPSRASEPQPYTAKPTLAASDGSGAVGASPIGSVDAREQHDASLSSEGESMLGDSHATRGDDTGYSRGLAHAALKQWAEAARAFEAAVAHDAKDFEAWSELSLACIRLKGDDNLSRARVAAEHAVQLNPRRCEGHYNLACVFSALGDTDAGLSALAEARKLNPAAVDKNAQGDPDLAALRATPGFALVLQGKHPPSRIK